MIGLALALAGCGSKNPLFEPTSFQVLKKGTIERTTIPGYRDNRELFVYLPHGHEERSRPYPVLVVLDGGSAFGPPNTFHIQKILDSLVFVGRVPPTAVVGIASALGDQRYVEYIPSFGGEVFLDGVRDTVLPEMRRRYGITSDPDSTYLIGSSLGGLMAVDAGFTHDDTFRRVAGLSVSYWAGALIPKMQAHGRGAVDRFYQDTGDGDDNSYDPLVRVETYARDSLGFTPGCDILTVLAHGDHDTYSWSHRMPSILEYLLGPPGPGCAAIAARP